MNGYLDGFESMRQDFLNQKVAQESSVCSLLEKLTKFRQMADTATPDKSKLEEVKATLQYKETQAKSSEETTVCTHHVRCNLW